MASLFNIKKMRPGLTGVVYNAISSQRVPASQFVNLDFSKFCLVVHGFYEDSITHLITIK